MVGSSKEQSWARSGPAPPSTQLVNWPLRHDGVRAWLMAVLIIAAGVLAGMVSGNPVMGCVASAALAIAAWRLWLPVRFELSFKGVTQTVLGRRRRIPWSEFARYEERGKGIVLLPDAEPNPLAPLRGLYIRTGGQREEILEVLDYFLNREPDSAATTHGAGE
jgi:hypothetical protein